MDGTTERWLTELTRRVVRKAGSREGRSSLRSSSRQRILFTVQAMLRTSSGRARRAWRPYIPCHFALAASTLLVRRLEQANVLEVHGSSGRPLGRHEMRLRHDEEALAPVVHRHSVVPGVRELETRRGGLDVDPDEIRLSMNDDKLFRQEFCCEFLDESSAFLTYEQIAGVEDASIDKAFDMDALSRVESDLYCGMDIGRHRDFTVMWVVEADGDALVTRAVRETTGEPFRAQYEALSGLLSLRRVRGLAPGPV